ncbi:CRISPR-associated protein Csx16 [Methanolacinia paynteri]|uniref:CRISPR-associated protein Csx16 n=1 Tax=Methanolacinia paynteri TaxID=230356 RepID=UPI00064E5F0B|nr:CRISPR-associated protein Csx16 [Methanolacinia paynteri]
MEKSQIIIVTRHPGAVEWLRSKGYTGNTLPHIAEQDIRKGYIYIGVLPIPMVKKILDTGSRFILLVLPDIAFSQRGQEMSPEEMTGAGACLMEVRSIDLVPFEG